MQCTVGCKCCSMCWKINQVDAVRLLLCWDKMLPVPSLITVMCGEVNITRGWPHWPWMSAVCHLLWRPSHRALACRVFSSAIIRLYLIMHASENTIHHAAGCNLQLSPRTELQNTLFFSTTFPSPLWISWYLSYSQTFTAFLFSRLLT